MATIKMGFILLSSKFLRVQTVKVFFIHFICLYLTCNSIYGQNIEFNNLQQQLYSVDHGIPSNEVKSIVEDGNGFLWIGTRNGIVRFDGSEFINIQFTALQPDSPIEDKFTFKLVYDPHNKLIWAGTNRGVFYCHELNWEFKRHGIYRSKMSDAVKDLLIVDTTLYLIGNRGLATINLINLESDVLFDRNHPLFKLGTSLAMDNRGKLWIGTLQGLVSLNLNNLEYVLYSYKNQPELRENRVRKLAIHKDQVIYGTWNGGMIRFNMETGEFNKLYKKIFDEFYYKGINQLSVIENELIATTFQGVIKGNLDSDEFEFYANDLSKGLIYGYNLTDSRGIMWFGSNYGLLEYSKSISKITDIELTDRSLFEPPLQIDRIIDYKDHLLIAALGAEGLYLVNKENLEVTIIKLPFPYNKYGLFHLTDIEMLSEDKFLIVDSRGLYQFDYQNFILTPLNLKLDISAMSVQDAVIEKDETIYLGSRNGGLNIISKSGNIKTFKQEITIGDTLARPWINNMYKDSNDNLWLNRGSETFYSIKNDSIYNYEEINEDRYQDVYGMIEDHKGRLWMAGGFSGLGYKFVDRPDVSVQHVKDGYYEKVFRYNDSLLWLMGRDLKLFNINTFELSDFDLGTDDIKSQLFGPIVKLENDKFAIAHKKGVFIFSTDQMPNDLNTERIYLNKLYSGGNEINVNLYLDSALINFPAFTKTVSFDFNTLSIGKTRGRYYYTLGSDYIPFNDDQNINITNLAHGTHNLNIYSGSNLDKNRNLLYQLKFEIPTPWYRTWWFTLISIVFLLISVIYIYSVRIQRIKIKKDRIQLQELNNLKTKFYSNISHELKTPLTVIMGITKALKNKLGRTQTKYDHDLEVVERNGQELIQLIDKMLGISKIDSGYFKLRMQESDFVVFIKYVLESFTYLANEKLISLEFNSQINSLKFAFDKDVMNTILSNLISNAIKFTPKGGKIIVKVTSEEDELQISVKDNGCGISKGDQNKIFNRYFMVKGTVNEPEGNGIGLSLTKNLIEKLNGKIFVESELGKGTKFTIKIPFAKNEMNNFKELTLHEDEQLDNSQISILIIEDNKDVRYYLRNILQPEYSILEAENGEKGIELAKTNLPDLVITDIMMPGITGIQVCNALKNYDLTDHIPVIILTAKGRIDDKIEGISSGADAFITKPFSELELTTRIKSLIDQRTKLIEKFKKDKGQLIEKYSILKPSSNFLIKANKSIETNLDNPDYGLHDLSDSLSLSESQVYRKIKALTGKSTAVYIRSYRLNRSMQMIKSEDLSVSEIAYSTGFNDPSWFSRAFKEEFGKSPSDYK